MFIWCIDNFGQPMESTEGCHWWSKSKWSGDADVYFMFTDTTSATMFKLRWL